MTRHGKVWVVAALVAGLALAGANTSLACDANVELLITEFMALNISTRIDEDGDYSDWIEIYNPCLPSVDVGGWYLTDDALNLTKWQLPSVDLSRGEFLLVFASGKNRAVAGSELHANFKLAAGGEFLALVEPDGTTIAQSFSPAYPIQYADVSYGLPQVTSDLISGGDTVSYRVPTVQDAALGVSWTAVGFDDSTWDSGPTGLGFTTGTAAGFAVTYIKANVAVSNLAAAEAVISDPMTQDVVETELAAVINYLNTGSSAHFGNDDPPPGTVIGSDVDDYLILATGSILIPSAGDWTFGVNSDDGFGLTLTREPHVFSSSFPGTRGAGDTLAVFDIPEPGAYSVRLVSFERGGGSEVEFFAAEGSHGSFDGDFHLVGDAAAGGLAMADISAQIGTNLQAVMQDVNSSLWSRAEFDVPDPGAQDQLELDIAYEDGFVAYLNGGEVASRNAPFPAVWNSTALTDRPNEDAGIAEKIDLTNFLYLLDPGTNVLAVHGLNDSSSDGDFLILPELSAAEETVDAGSGDYFTAPTPGSYNSTGYPGVSSSPTLSHPTGLYTDPFSLTVTGGTPGGVIVYTLDGSEPSETHGTEYTAPIDIGGSTRIRVRVLEPGLAPGPVITRLYSFLDPGVFDFDSNLPIVVVDTFGGGLTVNWLAEALLAVIPTTAGRAAITDLPEYMGYSGIRLRGSSSLGFPKKQYFVETWDENREDLDRSFLGLPPESDWILNGPYSDKSLMRNVLSYQWSNDIGRYAVRTRFVEMYLRSTTGSVTASNYVGVYVLMEKIKRDPNRVDITKIEPGDSVPPEVTGGYIAKKDRLDPDDSGFLTSSGQKLAYVEPKEDEITVAQSDYLRGYLNDFESALYGPDFTDPALGYANYIDADSFIDHHIVVEITKNIDGFRLSTFMFKDREARLNMGPVWDYNLCLGNANYLEGWLPEGWYSDLLGNSNYPWYRRLFEDDEFELRYADRWFAFRRGALQTPKLLADVDGFAALLDEAQERNFARWNILGSHIWPNYFVAETYQEEIAWMKQWLEDRVEWIDGQFFAPPEFNHPGGLAPAGLQLTMSAPAGTIYYTLDGTDPRLPGGGISPTAVAYTGPLLLTELIQVTARTLDGGVWSALNQTTYDPIPLAFVNEVLPVNLTVHSDEQGEFDPWVELYTPFPSVVDVGDLYLTDDQEVPDKWPLPPFTTICDLGWLLIWADGEPGEGPLHTNFALDPAGGSVWLFDGSGFLVDSLTYPALSGNVSFGRFPDGSPELTEFPYATPGLANQGIASRVLVNEYNAVSPAKLLENDGTDVYWGRVPGNGGDWFELVVVEDHLDIRGWQVHVLDDGSNLFGLTFTSDPILSDLRSGTIITVSEDLPSDVGYDPAQGDWWLNLRAGFSGDGLYISATSFDVSNRNTQITVLDDSLVVVFGPAGEGIKPGSGIGNDEVFKLEEDPGPSITPLSNYNDGSSSTFGAPNLWGAGTIEQDFDALRSVVPSSCVTDGDCNDGNPCTDDSCVGTTCEYTSNVSICDDGNPCTNNDVCGEGQCRGEIDAACCFSDCECDDGDQCTTDLCVANVCVNDLALTGTSCDDDDPCTENDACDAGTCAGTAVDCSGLDDDCNFGICNSADGQCEAQTFNEGGSCDDGDLCSIDSTCSAGVCSGGVPVDCTFLDDDCNVGTCNPVDGVCGAQPANEGGACDDGDLCTVGGTCTAGVCGALTDCSGLDDACSLGVCNPADGLCEAQSINEGAGCDDDDACTTVDSCQSGSCVGSVPPDCDDGDECTTDDCDPVSGCFSTVADDDTPCDDDDLCTETDVCTGGICGGSAVDCSLLDDQCNTGTCNPTDGQCEAEPANEGGGCDDGDLCTENDACASGTCSGSDVDCSGQDDDCNLGVCNPGDGQCEAQPINEAGSCEDGDLCTIGETCTVGVCAGSATDCSGLDGDCTLGQCNPADGQCEAQPINEAGACDDGDLCTVGATCSAGVCGAQIDCSGLDDMCNVGVCNGTSGECEVQPLADGTSCDDGDACTFDDSCQLGACVSGDPTDCDDGNECTDDTCDSGTGCVYTAVGDGTSCDDELLCTENDSCTTGVCGGTAVDCSSLDDDCNEGVCNTGTGGCEAQPVVDGTPCEDGDLCTEDDDCTGGVCGGAAVDCSSLDDACNVGVCDGGTGACEPQPVTDGTSCDDANACTVDDSCQLGVCTGGDPQDCDDGNECTDDTCDPVTGCFSAAVGDGTSCDDGVPCTENDSCTGGTCGGTAVDCSSLDDDCNVGFCNPGTGVCEAWSVMEGTSCEDGDACTAGDLCQLGLCIGGGPPDCDDGNECTDDSCDSGSGCFYTDNTAPCNDSDACTEDDTCGAGVCAGSTLDCDDGDVCTDDSCDSGTGCFYTDNTAPCDDGQACTENDVCALGICAGSLVDCSALGDICNEGVCNPGTGLCEPQPLTNGTACDDAQDCTANDACTDGVCGGAEECPSGQFCDPEGQCANAVELMFSDDGVHTGTRDTFIQQSAPDTTHGAQDYWEWDTANGTPSGPNYGLIRFDEIIGGEPDRIPPGARILGAQLRLVVWDSSTSPPGEVHETPVDWDEATVTWSTFGGEPDVQPDEVGAYVADAPTDMGAFDIDVTSSLQAWANDPNANHGWIVVPNSTNGVHVRSAEYAVAAERPKLTVQIVAAACDIDMECDDGVFCNGSEICDSGVCRFSVPADCDDGLACTTDSCDETADLCDHVPVHSLCDDGNECTGDTCEPGIGCINPAVDNGTACDDGDSCTTNDACSSGACEGGPGLTCDDGNSCTDDSCHPASGCVFVNNTAPCNDGDACTENDICGGGVCAGSTLDCDDGDVCTDDSCDSGTGCFYADNTAPCDDSDACTENDTCGGGSCTGSTLDCDDGDVCTDDSCDSGTGCFYTDNAAPCDDGDACTEDDICGGGVCAGSAVDCSDGDVCTDDSCDSGTGCFYADNAAPCDDSDACTENDTCGGGVCAGSTVDCNDGDVCTDDACDSGTGCVYSDNTDPCDDSDACTENDICGGGLCAGTALDCNDGNVCTVDSCFEGGCVYAPSGACGVTGEVIYYRDHSGAGSEPGSKPVPDVDIDVTEDGVSDATSDAGGAYGVGNLVGTVQVETLSKFGDSDAADHNGAITSFDATFVAQYAVLTRVLSDNQLVAADVTGNGSVGSFDASQIAQFVVQQKLHFDVAENTGSDWAFLRCDNYDDAATQDCSSPVYLHDPLTAPEVDDFYAVLYGDVTGNWAPQTGAPLASSAEELAAANRDRQEAARLRDLAVSGLAKPRSGEISSSAALELSGTSTLERNGRRRHELALAVKQGDGIQALDLVLKYNPDHVRILGARKTDLTAGFQLLSNDLGGEYRIAMYGVIPVEGSGPLLRLTVEVDGDVGTGMPLEIQAEANERTISVNVLGPGRPARRQEASRPGGR